MSNNAASTLDVAVYGIINAGKSSLINALACRDARLAGPIGGTTAEVEGVDWRAVEGEGPEDSARPGRYLVRLVDTPGLEEVADDGRGAMATEAARRADLVLFVLAEDLTATARRALIGLREAGKPILVVANKADLLGPEERAEVLAAIRRGLDGIIPAGDVIEASAAPVIRRRVEVDGAGSKVETVRGEADVGGLEARLLEALAASAGDLKLLAELAGRVDAHLAARGLDRASRRERAIRVADETSAALAVALAVNPVPLLDFLTGPGGLAILAIRVAEVYGENLSAEVARGLASDLIRGGRVALWGSLAATVAGGAFKLVPGLGHLAGAITQGASAGYFGHVVGRALVDYLDNGHDWGDGGLVAALDRVAATTDRKTMTRGLVDRIKSRLRGGP